MNKTCVYIVNDEPLYSYMTALSISSLRKYNKTIPVKLFFVNDDNRSSKKNSNVLFEKLNLQKINLDHFCDNNNVELIKKPFPSLNGEETYWASHRFYFKEINLDSMLLIDADTFIFDDINKIFEDYSKFDLVADKNNWGNLFKLNISGMEMNPFNSGVVLFNNSSHIKWAEELPEVCSKLYNKKHEFSEWIWKHSPKDCSGREELYLSLYACENKLNYEYFDKEHVITGKITDETKPVVFHSLTQNWPYYFKYFTK